MANHQVDTSGLVTLSARGCLLPGVQVAWAYSIRSSIVRLLESDIVDSTITEQALICACNLHPEALWWLEHKNEARCLILCAATTLQSLRQEFLLVQAA